MSKPVYRFRAPAARGARVIATQQKLGQFRRNYRDSQYATVATVKKLISSNLEHKFFDSKAYAQAATTTPTQDALSAIPQGDGDSQRDGDAINLVKLWFKFECYLQGTGGTNDFTDQVRLIFYRWHPMSAAAHPVPADVLIDLSVAQSATMSAYGWDNRKDFTILYDHTFALSGNGPSDLNTMGEINLGNIQSHFLSASTTLASNQIFAMVMSDSLVATHPDYNLYTRVIYTDA
jgi:hypothetical protein